MYGFGGCLKIEEQPNFLQTVRACKAKNAASLGGFHTFYTADAPACGIKAVVSILKQPWENIYQNKSPPPCYGGGYAVYAGDFLQKKAFQIEAAAKK